MFIQVLNVTRKVDLFKKRNSEKYFGHWQTHSGFCYKNHKIFWMFYCFLFCWDTKTKSNRFIRGLLCSEAQTHLFLQKYFWEQFFDYHGLGNKKMKYFITIPESQCKKNIFDSM